MNVSIRQALPSDAAEMHRVRLSVQENRLTSVALSEDNYVEAVVKRGRGWVVEQEGVIVAFAVGDSSSGSIWALFVEPGNEGRGYGRRLHDIMVEWLWEQGHHRLWLTTEPGTRAERFYREAGWARVGEVPSGEVRFELKRKGQDHIIMDVTLTFEDNGSFHDDLVLRIGDSVWRCDSYYLALDRGMLVDHEDASKVRAVLRALLERWRTAIENLTNGATAYLPYDFSDECTAWLACELVNGELLIMHGWADVEGWSIIPSDPLAYLTRPAGFHTRAGPWTVSVDDFLKGIARSTEATT